MAKSAKVFVGGLAWATDDQGLREAFEEFGVVLDAKVIMDRETGRSKGFGFVTFDNERDMFNAIDGMNEATLNGRQIRVNEAIDKPRESRYVPGRGPGGGGGSTGGGGGSTSGDRNYRQDRDSRDNGRDPGPPRGSGGGNPPSSRRR